MTFLKELHKPDILDCIAHLSSDEVFTPPKLVNEILDMLPPKLFTSLDTKFLDPGCKSGVFLREIAKRLIEGLKDQIPNLEKRIEHIFKHQIYGLAITELTGLLARRSAYCSKNANGEFSICSFDTSAGNIDYTRMEHVWEKGKCSLCGASQTEYDRGSILETHAYSFIHCNEENNTALFERLKNMKFDVIIGNPPYQLGLGNDGGNSSKAKAIYQYFISQAIKLSPRYITMIVPSRWMTRTTEGISEEWVNSMIKSNHFKIIHDFEDARDCFPGVDIKGGINYFLWEQGYIGKCNYYYHSKGNCLISHHFDFLDPADAGIVIRDPNDYSIIEKITALEGPYYTNHNFSNYVSPKDFFTNKKTLTSSWWGYKREASKTFTIKCYLNKNIHKIPFGWVNKEDISKNLESASLHKVYIPAAGGTGTDSQVLGKPFYGEPNSVCSQTYLVIGYDPQKHHFTKLECENIIKYIKTHFFRYLVSIKKKTQNGPRGVYQFVPVQDFTDQSDIKWNSDIESLDNQLYQKYGLTKEEVTFIESIIKPME